MGLEGVITALFLISGVSCLMVPPPEDVNVICQNVKTTAYWKYSKDQPQTTFRVVIKGTNGIYMTETTEHHYDLSNFVWESEENYMSFLDVTVTAIQGGNESKAVSSKSFSFNDLKTVETKCVLDFPDISVISEDTSTKVQFQNPIYFYKELSQTMKRDPPPEFNFIVSSVDHDGDSGGVCEAKERFCELHVTFPEGVKQCVTLGGELFDGSGTKYIIFQKTKQICATSSVKSEEEDKTLVFGFVVLGSMVTVIIVVLCIAICKVKAWTMETPDLPSFLKNIKNKVSKEEFIVGFDKSHMSPLSFSKDINRLQDDSGPVERRLGGESEELLDGCSQEEMAQDLPYGVNGLDGDSADGSQETESISVESEDAEERSPYDCPHNLRLDMGDGDMATGYTG